jgi:polar amino acid transport system substrate-binding protein
MRLAIFLTFTFLFFAHGFANASDKTIRISTSYTSLLSTPEQSGMLDQLIKEAFKRIGIKAEIIFTSPKRSLVAVNNGHLDGELNRIEGMEKTFPNLVRVPEPNMQMAFVAFAKRDIPISDWESLRGLRVGMVRGWKILERNTSSFPNVTHLLEVSDLFQMLEMDRLDVVLYSKLTGYDQLHKLGLNKIFALSPPLCTKDMFLYLHKSHEDLVAPLAKALRAMKQDGTYDQIVTETNCHPH